jgi:hypothetical protein
MMRIHIIYPHTVDGHCSAAVARLWAERNGHDEKTVDCYPVPVGQPPQADPGKKQAPLIDRLNDRVHPKINSAGQQRLGLDTHKREEHQIFLLALDLPADEMHELANWGQVTYCNHLQPYIDYDTCDLSVTCEAGLSTCENFWRGLFPAEPMPLAVQLVGRAIMATPDAKKAEKACQSLLAEEVYPFVYALRSVNSDPGTEDGWKEWGKHFQTLANAHTKKRIGEGRAIVRYLVRTHGDLDRPVLQLTPRSNTQRVAHLVDALAADKDYVANILHDDCTLSFHTSNGERVEIRGRKKSDR